MTASTCPPGIVNAAIEGAFGMYEAVTRGTVDYFTGALARRATPADIGLDVLTWIQETTRSKSPRWATEHTVVAEWPIARLRDFSSTDSVTSPRRCSSLHKLGMTPASSITTATRAKS